MHATRRAILETLRSQDHATVNDLAECVGVKAITIRHHLNGLLADGLVKVEEHRQNVGRPVHIFSLSQKGRALFPRRYAVLLENLLNQAKDSISAPVGDIIQSLAAGISEELHDEFAALSPRQRMRRLIEVLAEQGFRMEWQKTEDGYQLVEHHCPYFAFGQRYPEICQIDEAVIRTAMDTEITKSTCLLAGDTVCTYILQNA